VRPWPCGTYCPHLHGGGEGEGAGREPLRLGLGDRDDRTPRQRQLHLEFSKNSDVALAVDSNAGGIVELPVA